MGLCCVLVLVCCFHIMARALCLDNSVFLLFAFKSEISSFSS